MGDEQTVLDAGLHEYGARRLIDALGLDPDMSVERLRADLAIAARVRSCRPYGVFVIWGDDVNTDGNATAPALLGFLLGDNP